ncbi:MAG: hypothetical protein JWN57_199 [Frankiales bacterium]|jgi:uncharacterized protein (TIGR03083 family)|nr:hypothetical protein [Frankiales bacterium]
MDDLRTETGRVTALLREGSADLPVPGCPGWTVLDLTTHLGNVHVWAAAQVRARGEKAPYVEATPGEDLAAWYAACAEEVVAALEQAAPDEPAWGFGPTPRTAAFWQRRQLQETAVHRWDVEAALGREGVLDAELAADGIDEALTVFVPRQVALGRVPTLPGGLALRCDTGQAWQVGPDLPSLATVSGPAGVLLLLLWGRLPLSDPRLQVQGDGEAAAGVLGGLLP